jgi:hypothetical protein
MVAWLGAIVRLAYRWFGKWYSGNYLLFILVLSFIPWLKNWRYDKSEYAKKFVYVCEIDYNYLYSKRWLTPKSLFCVCCFLAPVVFLLRNLVPFSFLCLIYNQLGIKEIPSFVSQCLLNLVRCCIRFFFIYFLRIRYNYSKNKEIYVKNGS